MNAWARGPRIDWAETETGCWEWTGGQTPDGYGKVSLSGRTYVAHRLIYEWEIGPIPEGLTLDHLCRNRICVNPNHMEPVSNGENILRGESFSAKYAQATHCVNGHELTEENTYHRPDRPKGRGRVCRRCDVERHREAERRKRAVT